MVYSFKQATCKPTTVTFERRRALWTERESKEINRHKHTHTHFASVLSCEKERKNEVQRPREWVREREKGELIGIHSNLLPLSTS